MASDDQRDTAQLEADLGGIRRDMEDTCGVILRAVAGALVDLVRDEARRAVTASPAKAKALGQARLGSLKREVDAFETSITDQVERRINKAIAWPHREPFAPAAYGPGFRVTGPAWWTSLDAASQEIASGLGVLLDRYGLLPTGPGWHKSYQSSTPSYEHRVESRELAAARARYIELDRRLTKTATALARVHREREESEALELWNRA